MFFIGLVIVACLLYIWDYKILALVCFFFFLTSGFNLIPEKIMDIGPISKGFDFAFFIMAGILLIDSLCIKNYLRIDNFIKYLLVFGGFLGICIIYSKWVVGLDWAGILRTCRYQFFWLAYFIFRNLDKKRLEAILRVLFPIVVALSVLYLLQIVLGTHILNKMAKSTFWIGGLSIPRYYNQPDMLQFFTLLAIYHNPYKNVLKKITTFILICALLGAFHRSLMSLFPLMLLLGYIIRLSRMRRILLLSVLGFIVLCGISVTGVLFVQSRMYADLRNIVSGNFADVEMTLDPEDLAESTFTFRMAVLYERNQYVSERPVVMVLGAGLVAEDSKIIDKLFDFKIGLPDEATGKVEQIESGDISFSSLILRLGYFGTALYLMLWVYLGVFFYKNRENKYGFVSFLYVVMSICVAFFSGNLLSPVNYIILLITYVIIKKTNQEQEVPQLAM